MYQLIKKRKKITNKKLLDDILICFPLWFPLAYIFIASNYTSSSKIIFLITLFLFAETHFASTWLFFFNKENWPWLKKNLYNLVFLPLYSVFLICFVWVLQPSIILIIHYLASGWHVNKQSTGILNIYDVSGNFYKEFIYLTSFSCLVIGLINPGILTNNLNLFQTNFLLIFSFLIYSSILYLNSKNKLPYKFSKLMPFFTGMVIYVPILFFKDLATATAVGVGMHWIQYLSIMWSSYLRRANSYKDLKSKVIIKKSVYLRLIFIFTYSLIMTIFALKGMPSSNESSNQFSFFYLIPLIFQLYHFYIDGFIWKFSDPYIRKNVLPYIFSEN